jgi:hypothetical protein
MLPFALCISPRILRNKPQHGSASIETRHAQLSHAQLRNKPQRRRKSQESQEKKRQNDLLCVEKSEPLFFLRIFTRFLKFCFNFFSFFCQFFCVFGPAHTGGGRGNCDLLKIRSNLESPARCTCISGYSRRPSACGTAALVC